MSSQTIKIMFDFCSNCLWDKSGEQVELSAITQKASDFWTVMFFKWVADCDNLLSSLEAKPYTKVPRARILDLQLQGFRLAQLLKSELSSEGGEVLFSPVILDEDWPIFRDDVEVNCSRPLFERRFESSPERPPGLALRQAADEELDAFKSLLQHKRKEFVQSTRRPVDIQEELGGVD